MSSKHICFLTTLNSKRMEISYLTILYLYPYLQNLTLIFLSALSPMGNNNRVCTVLDFCFFFSCLLAISVLLFPICCCDARKSEKGKFSDSIMMMMIKRIPLLNRVEMDSSNSQPYGLNSPFSLPPFDSLPPVTLPENTPPFCIYPPFTPQQPPSTTFPFPPPPAGGGGGGGGYIFSPPPVFENPPSPYSYTTPPPQPPVPAAPGIGIVPSPPAGINVPSPWGYNIPSPPVQFLPPIVYPAPAVPPPPPRVVPAMALWCVAKPAVPEPIIQEAMNYACASGADCNQIQPSGSCFQPNTLLAHASYAFNSYWQRTKVAGGTCEFGGTAMLVTVDPSYDGCRFIYF